MNYTGALMLAACICLLIGGSQTWAPPTLDGSCQSMNPSGQNFKTDACPIPKLIPAMEHPLAPSVNREFATENHHGEVDS